MGYCVPYELVNTRTLVVCTYVDTRGRIKKKTKKEEEKRCGSNFGKYSNRKYFFFCILLHRSLLHMGPIT